MHGMPSTSRMAAELEIWGDLTSTADANVLAHAARVEGRFPVSAAIEVCGQRGDVEARQPQEAI